MTEEQLNKEQLRKNLKGFSYSNELLDKILELLSNQYINGLEQSRFDKRMLEFENQELREQIRKLKSMSKGLDSEKRMLKVEIVNYKNSVERQQKELIKFLEDEKYRLAKEYSATYEDDLGNLRYINEDIFNELNKILSKYKEIIGVNGD